GAPAGTTCPAATSGGGGAGGGCCGGGGGGGNPIYMYRATTPSATYTGLTGARLAADTRCSNARAGYTFPVNTCSSVRAFLSLSAGDAISTMAANYAIPTTGRAIHGPTGIPFQNDWNDLMNGA